MRRIQKLKKAGAMIVLPLLTIFAVPQLLGGNGTVLADTAYGYILPDSSWTYLSEENISDMSLQVVCYAKNEIYARNGRTFTSAELQNYFDQQYWYSGIYSPEQFSEDMLNEYEIANVTLLADRETQLGSYALDSGNYSYDPVYQYIDQYYNGYSSQDSYYVDPDSYILYDSDRRYLAQSELGQMTLQEINYAKNEIYARKGYIFQSAELSDYFNQKNWYWGSFTGDQFSANLLNDYEKANAALLEQEEGARQNGGYQLDQPGYSYSGVRSFTSYDVYTPSADDYIIWDSNIRYLSEEEVRGLSLQQLNYARNEIYARRGYIFQSQELRDYFSGKYWYHGTVPGGSFSTSVFNEYELANIDLLKNCEYSISPNGYQLY